jgi:hypothetical protein
VNISTAAFAPSAGEHPENRNPYPYARAATRKQEGIMNRCTKFMLAGIALLGLAVAALPRAGFAQSDPFIGTWQLNLAKSKFSPGPGPKSATMNVQGEGENHNVTFAGITRREIDNRLCSRGFTMGCPIP